MDIRFQCKGAEHWKADVALVFYGIGEKLSDNPHVDALAPWLAIAPAARDLTGKKGTFTFLHGHPELAVPRILAIGLGERDAITVDSIRSAVATALQRCRSQGLSSVLLIEPLLAELPGGRERLLEECVYAALVGIYRYQGLKKKDDEQENDPEWLAIGFAEDFVPDAGQAAARRGERSAEALCLARRLANTPPNLLGPVELASYAQEIASETGLRCTILEEDALQQESMSCLLAVGQGSSRPARLIVLEHAPQGAEQEKPLIFVGKGITFDTGGICIKPASNMHTMKSDMSGAAIVLSVLKAIAEEGIQRRVIGLMACAENMPDGQAMRPGDVVIAANGDSVEIQNTDAEGRLALCDALAYAQKQWTPAAMVDIATLTGACAVALGDELAGLFCDDASLRERLIAAGKTGGESLWALPLWAAYKEKLKSDVADICHMGSREGGAIHAALFLQHFIRDGVRWAHLDIAGVDWASSASGLRHKGATAFGVRTLLELARGGV